LQDALAVPECKNDLNQLCRFTGNCPQFNQANLNINGMTFGTNNFDVVSFGSTNIPSGGRIGGRVAVRNDFLAGDDVIIGNQLRTDDDHDDHDQQRDASLPYALVVGRNAQWTSGALFPNGGKRGNVENIFVGGQFNAPANLAVRRTGGPCASCLDPSFTGAQGFYTYLSSVITKIPTNVTPYFTGTTLNLACNNSRDAFYFVNVDGAYISMASAINPLDNCNPNALWVINIGGVGDVSLRAPINCGPNIIINFLSGASAIRTLFLDANVNAFILAPGSNVFQRSGTLTGSIVAVDVTVSAIVHVPCTALKEQATTGFPTVSPIPTYSPGYPSYFTTGWWNQYTTGYPFPTASPIPTFTTGKPKKKDDCKDKDKDDCKDHKDEDDGKGHESGGIPSPIEQSKACPFFEVACSGLNFQTANRIPVSFTDYAVISFGGLVGAATGAIEGAAIVRNNVQFAGDFTIGTKAPVAITYGLVSGRSVYWPSGILLPATAGIFVGGNFAGSNLLLPRVTGGPCPSPGCLDDEFDRALRCYLAIQNDLLRITPNVDYKLEWSGLRLDCQSWYQDLYVLNIPGDVFSQVLWFMMNNCNPNARWVVNIVGNSQVNFRGGSFPTNPNRVVYNIPDQRIVTIQDTLVLGNILAPRSTFNQNSGYVVGKVIVGDIVSLTRVNAITCTGKDGSGIGKEGDPWDFKSSVSILSPDWIIFSFFLFSLFIVHRNR